MKRLWIIPSAILSANVLILIFGIATNSGFIGTLFGGLMAIT